MDEGFGWGLGGRVVGWVCAACALCSVIMQCTHDVRFAGYVLRLRYVQYMWGICTVFCDVSRLCLVCTV